MENVYSTPLSYKNFNGAKKKTTLHFHLTPREFTDWLTDNMSEGQRLLEVFTAMSERAEENPDANMEQSDIVELLKFIKVLTELSYGVPSDDGEVFDKRDLPLFVHSAKYDAFRLFLFTNPKELNEFANTLLNEKVIEEFSKVIEAVTAEQAGDEENPALKSVPEQVNYDKMTKAQLIEAMKEKTKV